MCRHKPIRIVDVWMFGWVCTMEYLNREAVPPSVLSKDFSRAKEDLYLPPASTLRPDDVYRGR